MIVWNLQLVAGINRLSINDTSQNTLVYIGYVIGVAAPKSEPVALSVL